MGVTRTRIAFGVGVTTALYTLLLPALWKVKFYRYVQDKQDVPDAQRRKRSMFDVDVAKKSRAQEQEEVNPPRPHFGGREGSGKK
eukprot:scaffold156149_cov24-Tisochrysis_lutea.AAC.1